MRCLSFVAAYAALLGLQPASAVAEPSAEEAAPSAYQGIGVPQPTVPASVAQFDAQQAAIIKMAAQLAQERLAPQPQNDASAVPVPPMNDTPSAAPPSQVQDDAAIKDNVLKLFNQGESQPPAGGSVVPLPPMNDTPLAAPLRAQDDAAIKDNVLALFNQGEPARPAAAPAVSAAAIGTTQGFPTAANDVPRSVLQGEDRVMIENNMTRLLNEGLPTANRVVPSPEMPAPVPADILVAENAPMQGLAPVSQPQPEPAPAKPALMQVAAIQNPPAFVPPPPPAAPLPPQPPSTAPAPVSASQLQPAPVKNASPADQPDQKTADAMEESLPPAPSPKVSDADGVRPEVVKAWALQLEALERENQALREKAHMNETDHLSDIKVDAVAQIHEDVLRARIAELEKEMDKLNMKNDTALPQKTEESHPAPGKKNKKADQNPPTASSAEPPGGP